MNKRRPDRDPELVRKVIVVVSIALALLVTLICIVDVILIRRRLASRPAADVQVVQPATAEPKSVPTMAPPTQAPPTIQVVPTFPPPTSAPPPVTTWRFLRIDSQDIATFENVADPSQTLLAKCIDTRRPPPNKGAIYLLDDSGILKPESGGKKYQRFKVTGGQ